MRLPIPLTERVKIELGYLLAAFQLLTRLPVPQRGGFEPNWIGRGTAYFPIVGLVIGAICAAVLLASASIWPAPIPALLAVIAGAAATGALHEDGLADTADGLGGADTPDTCLEIMKDSRIGTYGTLALIFATSLKVAALSALNPLDGALALILAHMSARVVPVLAASRMPYVGWKDRAKIGPITDQTPRRRALAVVLGIAPLLIVPLPVSLLALGLGTLAATGVLSRARHVLNGITGDVLGASEQAFEVGVLLGLAGGSALLG